MKKISREFSQFLEFIAEWTHQIAYVGFVIAALFIIYATCAVKESVVCTLFVIAHFISIAVSGYEIGESSFEKAKAIKFGFIVLNVIFVLGVKLITNSVFVLLLAIYMLVIGSIYLYFTLRYIHSAYGVKDNWIYRFRKKHKNMFYILVLLLPVIAVAISLIFLPWNVYVKIVIILIYVISMPFIGMAAENGFDLEEVFLI